jgi:hypothetical protein
MDAYNSVRSQSHALRITPSLNKAQESRKPLAFKPLERCDGIGAIHLHVLNQVKTDEQEVRIPSDVQESVDPL